MNARFQEIIKRVEFPLFVTNGADGFPRARPMRLLTRKGWTLWFATSRSSNKVGQIAADARVTVIFADMVRFNYAYLYGRAQLIADEAQKRRWWDDSWIDDWPDGSDNPDYILIKVIAIEGLYYYGESNEYGKVVLSGSDRPGSADR